MKRMRKWRTIPKILFLARQITIKDTLWKKMDSIIATINLNPLAVREHKELALRRDSLKSKSAKGL